MTSRKGTVDVFQTKTTRNDRFAQMSHQEKIIEQKKKEIQARLEQKQKGNANSTSVITASNTVTVDTKMTNLISFPKQNKSCSKQDAKSYNQFSNDGSFLDQFKLLKDKKLDQKLKSFRSIQDRTYSEDRYNNKNTRWSQRRRSPSPKSKSSKASRFSDKHSNIESKINISSSYSNLLSQTNFHIHSQLQSQICITAQNVIGRPLLKNDIAALPSQIVYPSSVNTTSSVIAASPVMLTVPPPHMLVHSPTTVTTTAILTSVSTAPPNLLPPTMINSLIPPPTTPVGISTPPAISLLTSCAPTIELGSIPPPNPIQIQNIPQPEPINTHNIPPPAPLQVQNIPPPSPIQLNEIPNPKPMDVMNIPTPTDGCLEKTMSDPNFIKSIPPPNKSVPPPSLQDTTINVNITVPPPNALHPVTQTIVALPQSISVQSLLPSQNLVVHSVPPPQILANLPTVQNVTLVSQVSSTNVQTLLPPPPPPSSLDSVSTISVSLSIPTQAQIGVAAPVSTPTVIPSLLAQPVLPPAGLPVNLHCPPPVVLSTSSTPLSTIPASFVNQPPPITSQLPPVNVPPPSTLSISGNSISSPFKDLNAVCPPGTSEYEAMASLGRMVAQCGPGIEDIVRQRKPRDPNLWFLFRKESAAYQQYAQLVEQFKHETVKTEARAENYEPEDIYEPEMANEDDLKQEDTIKYRYTEVKLEREFLKKEHGEDDCKILESLRRKRKSRWGGKDSCILPSTNVQSTASLLSNDYDANSVVLSKITRTDAGLVGYVLATYGTTNLTDEEWKKAEDNFKINIVYQDMLRKREEIEKLAKIGKNKYEYDSDEETDGGTWEHKLRVKEMCATQEWATELNKNAQGKHHIGDFLPPEELKRFMESEFAFKEGRQPDISDYKDFKLKEDNVGFKMLQKLGWSEGQGLGAKSSGIVDPVNKAHSRDQNQGLGLENVGNVETDDDEYDAYRKRMMLAYRFRPNPLNNPRRPYY